MAEIRGIFDYIREALGEQISPVGSAYSKFLEFPVEARRGLISDDYRKKVENMPIAPYTGDGNFQGILGSTEAEKINGYSGSDPTDYDISGENISNTDKFVADSILGTADLITQPDVIGKELVDIGSGLLQKATGEVTNQEQVNKANLVQDSVASLFTPEGFNKSMYETGGAVALPVGGAYLGVKGLQLSKALHDRGIQPAMSVRDISTKTDKEITAPVNEQGFYDVQEQLLMDLPQEVNTPTDVRRYLTKRGVKVDQMKESGLLDYLNEKSKNNERVTKAGLLSFIGENKVQLEETVKVRNTGMEADRIYEMEDFDPENNTLDNADRLPDDYSDENIAKAIMEDDVAFLNPENTNFKVVPFEQAVVHELIDVHDELGWENVTFNKLADYFGEEDATRLLSESNPTLFPKEGLWKNQIDRDANMNEEVLDKMYDLYGKKMYAEKPVIQWEVNGYKIYSSDEGGYSIVDPNGRDLGDDIYDLDEAVIQIREDLIENGTYTDNYTSVMGRTSEYDDFTHDDAINMDTYEEVLVQTPMGMNKDERYIGSHFKTSENVNFHIRMADKVDDPNTKKVIELQSDVHQAGRQKGYRTEETERKVKEYKESGQKDRDEQIKSDLLDQEMALDKEKDLVDTNYFAYNNLDMKELVNSVYGDHSTAMRKNPKLKLFFDKIVKMSPTDVGSIQSFYENISPSNLYFDKGNSFFKPDVRQMNRWTNGTDQEKAKLQRIYNEGVEELLKLNNFGKKLGEASNKRKNIKKQLYDINEKFYTTAENQNIKSGVYLVPDAPFKNERWVKVGVERAIHKARQEGKDAIEFVDSKYALDNWNRNNATTKDGRVRYKELFENIYDNLTPSILRKYEKKYGGKLKKLDDGGYRYEFDEKSRNVKGVPLASTGGLLSIDQMQDDDKMTNKQGLLA